MNETINHTEFAGSYYLQLVNDIAAAKALLERKNDAKDLNSSNIIVIGAGQGATLGAIWMASEFHRKKALGINMLGQPMLDADSEGKDLAAAIWISISSTLGGRSVPVSRYLQEITNKENKVRTAFIYGSGRANEAAKNLASSCLSRAPKEIVARHPINSALAGSSLLLANKKDASNWIIKPLLPAVIKARGDREWRRRKADENAYFWVLGRNMVPAKLVNEEMPRLLPGALINR